LVQATSSTRQETPNRAQVGCAALIQVAVAAFEFLLHHHRKEHVRREEQFRAEEAGRRVAGTEDPPDDRIHAQHIEIIPGDQVAPQPLAVARQPETGGEDPVGGQARERVLRSHMSR
jgi:hypothetical protein